MSRRIALTRRAIGLSFLAAPIWQDSTAKTRGRGTKVYTLISPDKKTMVTLEIGGAWPAWSVTHKGKPALLPSGLGLWLENGQLLGQGAQCIGADRNTATGTWAPPFGSSNTYSEAHNELVLHFTDANHGIAFDIIARAYDAGAAIRYRVTKAPQSTVRLMGERTEFRFPQASLIYSSRDEGGYQVSTQGDMAPVVHPDLTNSSDHGNYADLPVTVDTRAGVFALVAESDRLHYPRAMLTSKRDGLVTYLMRYPGRATGWGGPGDTPEDSVFDIEIGQATPWRALLLADSAAGLIEQTGLVPTLATPNILGDVSWVRPGRAIRITKPYSTEKSLKVVDFAAAHKLEYVEYDAHWYGDGTDASDPTYSVATLDLAQVIAYARARNIGVILYIDRVAVTAARDAMCKLYQSWGVAGVKLGFMWEGRQSDNDFIFDVVKAFGEHGMLVNLHDNLRPAGLERTLPNYVALEGVRGNEQFPTARHNVTLPFTRSIAGPLDYTICYANAKNQTTNAHQLAMAAVYYNPLTFLYWYDTPDKYVSGFPELRWFDECPTTWDESHALHGAIGEYVVMARRHAERWFLGAMTNERGRQITVDMSFLEDGPWTAEIYRDGDLSARPFETPVIIETRDVGRQTRLDVKMNPSGGQAILFTKKI